MRNRPSTAAQRIDVSDEDATIDDPVLHATLTAPIRPGEGAPWEAEALADAAEEPWFEGASVSDEIATRARRGQ
ncbi:hypothetical protein [Polyangium aurulentum]|uniref:hypothetical protein n=1 Tax=Polyangium aurulentum TaxID=2567896 RepID=UPI0010ADED63|nr:hypothetical protein [Polyangium aurulentum]UQA60053.1 hypothetical protein E8A73_006085 [Polyangium aurulentum]